MAKFRMVHTEFWNDPKVMEDMTPEDKYFFLYLLTNQNTSQVGIYQITKKQMAFDTGYSLDTITSLLDRFIKHHKILKYNETTREIAIRNWGKYNLNRGGKPMTDCVGSELREVKDTSLITYVGESVEHSAIKCLYDTYHDTSTISGQEEEKEKEEYKEEEKEKPMVTKFIEFWTLYPRKVKKKDAESAFKSLIRAKTDVNDLMTATTNYVQAVKDKEQEYIMHPTTFLRKDRWKDYLEPVVFNKPKSQYRKTIDTLDRLYQEAIDDEQNGNH